MNISILEWDSDFFQLKVARINDVIENENDLSIIAGELSKHHIDLAYYSHHIPISNNFFCSEYSIKLVDEKTTYKKSISGDVSFSNSVSEYAELFPEKILLDLSVESGAFSRFKMDEQIGREKFEELYKQWIINSVNKKLARQVLVYRTNGIISGFVTLGEKNARADIGIIAVDANSRGQGIGKALMFSAEKWFFVNSEFLEIQVVTQAINTAACALYEHCGYQVDDVVYIYHFWKQADHPEK